VTDTLIDLSALATDLRLDGHLVECPHKDVRLHECRWCHWAISTPEIKLLLDLRHDTHRLLGSDAADTVPWVTATTTLLQLFDEIDLHAIEVPSVRLLAERLQRSIMAVLDQLRSQLRSAVAGGGPVEQRCLHTAGQLAAAAIQQPEHTGLLDHLPPSARHKLAGAAATLSTDVQVVSLLSAIEQLHSRPLPTLRTQPEWRRRPSLERTNRTAASGAATHGCPSIAPGSLEALVVEAVIGRVTDILAEVATLLSYAVPPVTMIRPLHGETLSPETRAVLWRIARIDWHLTFVDTGQADCWNARVEGDHIATDVPWQVALAIDVAGQHGLMSATHQNRPAMHGAPELSS
jgi:hypothetical protein